MNKEAKSAVFGLNWLQDGKTGDVTQGGSYDVEQEVWAANDGEVQATFSTLYTSYCGPDWESPPCDATFD